MKQYIKLSFAICWLVTVQLTSCADVSTEVVSKTKLSDLDKFWLPFANAMDSGNIDFLIENSLDSLSCYGCMIFERKEKEVFDAKNLLSNNLEDFAHVSNLASRSFSTYELKNKSIKISYSIKSNQAPEGAYSLIFTLVQVENEYVLEGMMLQ